MKKIILMLCIGLFSTYAIGQQKQIDSLSEILKHTDGKEQIDILFKITDIYLTNNPEKSLVYSELALEKSKELSDNDNSLIATEKIGNAYLLIGNIEKAYKYFNIILDEKPSISNPDYDIKLLAKKGKIYDNLGEFDKAIICYQNSLKLAETINDSSSIAFALNNIGYIYFLMQDYNTSLKYFHKALPYFLKLNDQQGISDTYNRIGIIYGITNSNDSALYCFYKSLGLQRKINSTEKLVAILDNIGEVYLQKNIPDSSLKYFNQSYNFLLKKDDIYGMPYVLNYLSKVYIAKKDYKKAFETLNHSKSLASKIKYWYISEIYLTYSDYYVHINDFKNAYNYLKLHYSVKDSIFNVKKKHKVSELQIIYETNKKEKQILSLNKENELIQMNLKKKNIIIILSILGIIIIAIFTFATYVALKIKNKANRLLNIKNREIELQRQEISIKNDVLERQKQEIITQKESLEDTNAELGKINVYLEKLSNRNVHTDLAVIIASDKGVVESVNLGFFNMFGFTFLEFSGFFNSLTDWYGSDEVEQINKAIKTRESINFETIHKSKAENTLFVQTTIIPLTDVSGNIIKILSIETEITKF